jgi:hypothetical protein
LQLLSVKGQQIPSRLTVPSGQQRLLEQRLPRRQALRHRPQWLLLFRVSTQVPLQQVVPVSRQQGRVELQAAPAAAHRLQPPLRQFVPAQQSASELQAVPWQAAAGPPPRMGIRAPSAAAASPRTTARREVPPSPRVLAI